MTIAEGWCEPGALLSVGLPWEPGLPVTSLHGSSAVTFRRSALQMLLQPVDRNGKATVDEDVWAELQRNGQHESFGFAKVSK